MRLVLSHKYEPDFIKHFFRLNNINLPFTLFISPLTIISILVNKEWGEKINEACWQMKIGGLRRRRQLGGG